MQLLLISEITASPGCSAGDVVGVFDDSHVFSAKERELFSILYTSKTRDEIEKSVGVDIIGGSKTIIVAVIDGIRKKLKIKNMPQYLLHHDVNGLTSNLLKAEWQDYAG